MLGIYKLSVFFGKIMIATHIASNFSRIVVQLEIERA